MNFWKFRRCWTWPQKLELIHCSYMNEENRAVSWKSDIFGVCFVLGLTDQNRAWKAAKNQSCNFILCSQYDETFLTGNNKPSQSTTSCCGIVQCLTRGLLSTKRLQIGDRCFLLISESFWDCCPWGVWSDFSLDCKTNNFSCSIDV